MCTKFARVVRGWLKYANCNEISKPAVAEANVERKKKVEVVQFAGYNAVPLLDFSSTVNSKNF